MPVLVGIDEAGFGPLLGPLVVSSSVFRVEESLLGRDMWKILRRSTGKCRRGLAGRLLVADSKQAYSKSTGTRHLERTVLACVRCCGAEPRNLDELLEYLCPDCLQRLKSYPWYRDAGLFEIGRKSKDISLASRVFEKELARNGIIMSGLSSCCLDVSYYNRMVASVRNKSRVLFTATCRLMKHALDNHPGEQLQIIIDRQGGRVRYRSSLQRMFPDMELEIIKENAAGSSYKLQSAGKRMRVHFAVSADENHLPVSLASMVSKYVRELLIYHINRYFRGFHPELKPTSGYWKDGMRFIEDIRSKLPGVAYEKDQLIRSR